MKKKPFLIATAFLVALNTNCGLYGPMPELETTPGPNANTDYYTSITNTLISEGTIGEPAMVGEWLINGNLPALKDDSFDQAVANYDGMSFIPVLKLATQVVAGTNTMYLTYGTPITPNAASSLKVVTVYKDLSGNSSILRVADFHLSDYVQDASLPSNSEEHLAGGWNVCAEMTSLLDEPTASLFAKALASSPEGNRYQAICVLGRQVVAGTNYTILAKLDSQLYVVTMYVDLENNAAFTSECAIDLLDF